MKTQNKFFSITSLFLVGIMAVSISVTSCKKKPDPAVEAQRIADSTQKAEEEAKVKLEQEAAAKVEEAKKAADEAMSKLPEKAKTFIIDFDKLATEIKDLSEKIKNKDTDPTLGTKLAAKLLEATGKQGKLITEAKSFGLTPEQQTFFDTKVSEIKAVIEMAKEVAGKK